MAPFRRSSATALRGRRRRTEPRVGSRASAALHRHFHPRRRRTHPVQHGVPVDVWVSRVPGSRPMVGACRFLTDWDLRQRPAGVPQLGFADSDHRGLGSDLRLRRRVPGTRPPLAFARSRRLAAGASHSAAPARRLCCASDLSATCSCSPITTSRSPTAPTSADFSPAWPSRRLSRPCIRRLRPTTSGPPG